MNNSKNYNNIKMFFIKLTLKVKSKKLNTCVVAGFKTIKRHVPTNINRNFSTTKNGVKLCFISRFPAHFSIASTNTKIL